MQLSSEQTIEKLVELLRPQGFHLQCFHLRCQSNKHRAAKRLQNVGKASAWKWELMAWIVSAGVTTQECE